MPFRPLVTVYFLPDGEDVHFRRPAVFLAARVALSEHTHPSEE